MSKGLYVIGTGTDVGKTYISALLLKALRRGGYDTGYYKAVVSGAPSFAESDAAYVNAQLPSESRKSSCFHTATLRPIRPT